MTSKQINMGATNVLEPTMSQDGLHGARQYKHPAFGMISASRVSGQANLFKCNTVTSGFVDVSISGAVLEESVGADEWTFPVLSGSIVRVRLSEAQWAAFVSRMNTTGVPCTITQSLDMDSDYRSVPELPNPETPADRLARKAEGFAVGEREDILKLAASIREKISKLPKGVRDDIEGDLQGLTSRLDSNHRFHANELSRDAARLSTECQIEINAMVTDLTTRLGKQALLSMTQDNKQLAIPSMGSKDEDGSIDFLCKDHDCSERPVGWCLRCPKRSLEN